MFGYKLKFTPQYLSCSNDNFYFHARDYSFGFNGKDKESEFNSGAYDFGARIHDARLGRWMGIDYYVTEYPNISSYSYVANSPISHKDPDGKLIIFINGLWGWPNEVGQGGTVDYWGTRWVECTQAAIGDFSSPLYYDGSFGGTNTLGASAGRTNNAAFRQQMGKHKGYKDAANIVASLKTNDQGEIVESIKFVTNSMGAAYERGFSEGLVQWVNEENFRRTLSNNLIELDKQKVVEAFNNNEMDFKEASKQLNELDAKKQILLSVEIEMVVDLDAHQIDSADPNASKSYYTLSNYDDRNLAEQAMTDPRHVQGATQLCVDKNGNSEVRGHHSSFVDCSELPADSDGCK